MLVPNTPLSLSHPSLSSSSSSSFIIIIILVFQFARITPTPLYITHSRHSSYIYAILVSLCSIFLLSHAFFLSFFFYHAYIHTHTHTYTCNGITQDASEPRYDVPWVNVTIFLLNWTLVKRFLEIRILVFIKISKAGNDIKVDINLQQRYQTIRGGETLLWEHRTYMYPMYTFSR